MYPHNDELFLQAWDAIHKSKSSSGASSPDIYEARKKWTSESKRYNAYSGELNKISRISSFRRSGAAAAGVSSFQSKPQSQAENNQFRKLKFPSQGHESFQDAQSQGSKRSSNSRNLSMEIGQESMSLQLVQSSFDKGTKFNNKQIVVVDDGLGKNGAESVMLLLSPPLPKSPSESWLCRALPLVSLKSPSMHLSRGSTQSQAVKRIGYSRASSYSKWETIVKTSNLHHNHEFCSKVTSFIHLANILCSVSKLYKNSLTIKFLYRN